MTPVNELGRADLVVDAHYAGGRKGNAGDDPLNHLVGVSNQGGFRILGTVERPRLVVITSSLSDPDWPDELDHESGAFVYFGDNKKPGTELHDTRRWGNRLLRQVFSAAHGAAESRRRVPPILVFSRTGVWRDVMFRGLAVPGMEGLSQTEDLVAIWKTKNGQRFQNYRAFFTILDVPVVSRMWLDAIRADDTLGPACPSEFLSWVEGRRYKALRARPTVEVRSREEQLPSDDHKRRMLQEIRETYLPEPHSFEAFASRVARLHLGSVTSIEVTRPRRDGGRDAIGVLRLGSGPSSIAIDFALEAKCYSERNSVGVKDMSRLISRLRHRQFGVLVTTSYVHSQAYQEVKDDKHPIVIISGGDLVDILVAHGINSLESLQEWMRSDGA